MDLNVATAPSFLFPRSAVKRQGNAERGKEILGSLRHFVPSVSPCHSTGVSLRWRKSGKRPKKPKQQALTFGFSFPTLLGLLPTVVLIIALATVGKKKPNQCPSRYIPGLLVLLLLL